MTRARGYEAVHECLTEAFPRARTARERARWELSDEQIADFRERGFLLDLPLLDEPQVLELRARLQSIGEHLHLWKERLYEVEEAWRFIDHIERAWHESDNKPAMAEFVAGSWGPREADDMIKRDGFAWRRL